MRAEVRTDQGEGRGGYRQPSAPKLDPWLGSVPYLPKVKKEPASDVDPPS